MMPPPLVLRVLGPVRVTGARHPLTSQQLALLTRLACVGPARREVLVDALWDGRPISDARFANLLSEVRASIGRRHLPPVVDHHYRVADLPTDLDLLLGLAAPSERTAATAELAALEAAVGLIRGPVFATPADRSWRWLDGHPEIVAQAAAAVGRVTHRLVAVLWATGDLDRAREICQQGLAWCPLDEALMAALEGLHRAQGRPAAAHRLRSSWRHRVERLAGEAPMPMTPA